MGDLLTRVTIWVALGLYAVGAAGLLLSRGRPTWLRAARLCWTAGCAVFLAHVFCAFNFYYGWSHATAAEETARQTAETVGLAWGGGVWVSYAFTLGWAADVVWWWWGGPESYLRRPRWALAAWQAFMLFIIFNGTVVFETGAVRWLGLAICGGLALLWWRRRHEPMARGKVVSAWLVALLLSGAGCAERKPTGSPEAATLVVAAASDLLPAFEEMGGLYEAATGAKVVFNFSSTGTLAKQIESGAPIDLFAAANVSFVDELEQKGLIIPETKALYGRGRITLWAPAGSKLRIDRVEDLARPEVRRVAMANPEHAPYGVAGREALQAAGVWEAVRPKLVSAENVRMALQFAETGNVDVAIVALSLSAQSPGRWNLIPEGLHRPLDQALAVVKSTAHEPQARAFAAFVTGPQGRVVMRKYGFFVPDEGPIR